MSTDSEARGTTVPASGGEESTDLDGPDGTYSPRVGAYEPYRDLIEEQLRLGRNAKVIWQDLVDD